MPAHYDGTILIIDGDFHQSLAVSPNEILRLLDDGTEIIGAASMGALRAVELGPFGMQGCGWIYEAYRSGLIEADDEVAVAYSQSNLRPVSVPLVNVRYWLQELESGGHVTNAIANRMVRHAGQIYYPIRTFSRLKAAWTPIVGQESLDRLISLGGGRITDVKAADARLALELVAQRVQ